MARVTVEDCVTKVPNRFELVMLSAQRARDVSSGAPITVERDNDKNPVIALREIAEETVALESLRETLVRSHQRHVESERSEEDLEDLEEEGSSEAREEVESMIGKGQSDEDREGGDVSIVDVNEQSSGGEEEESAVPDFSDMDIAPDEED